MAQKKLSVEQLLSVLRDIPDDRSDDEQELPFDIESDDDEFIPFTSSLIVMMMMMHRNLQVYFQILLFIILL